METIAAQLRNCAQAIVTGGLASLSESLRIEADALHQQKQRLLIEREQLRADLAECEQGGLDAVRIRQSLARFSEIMPTLSLGQQRDLVALFLERVDVRPSKAPGKVAAGTRLLELRLKLRVARLIEGMEERLVIEQREAEPVTRGRALALTLEVALAQAGNPVPVSILAPFRCDLGTRKPSTAVKPDLPAQHAIHRARAWQRRLDAETGLLRITLAAEERVSPATVTQHLKLLELDQDLQAHLLNLTKASEVRRFSLNQLTRLAGLPLDEQKRRFADLSQLKVSTPTHTRQ